MVASTVFSMYNEETFWLLYDLVKKAKPDLSHDEIIKIVEEQLSEKK